MTKEYTFTFLDRKLLEGLQFFHLEPADRLLSTYDLYGHSLYILSWNPQLMYLLGGLMTNRGGSRPDP